MELSIETSSYNEKRYGKPWIAKVDFSENKKGKFFFGDWIGSKGGTGYLEVTVDLGDIVAKGQKDFRGNPRNSAPIFYRVTDAGELEELGDKGDAYKYYKSQAQSENNPLSKFSDEEIKAEAKKRNII